MTTTGDHILDGSSVLVTGGTGSFGKAFIDATLRRTAATRIVVLSRDELKQADMQRRYAGERRLRFFIGDVRDRDRLRRAFNGVDYVIHAAALKQVPTAEYNPFEAVKTNIHGAQNVIDAAIDEGVQRVIALSTDKACAPVNLYGATKLVSDRLFTAGNAYAGGGAPQFAVVRYGNVVGSRGSVVPVFRELAKTGALPITDERMTRFWLTLDRAVAFVFDSLASMRGGELFVPKIPSMRVVDLAAAMAPEAKLEIVGIRPGEKLHEEMISASDARSTVDMGSHYIVQPEFEWWQKERLSGQPVPEGFNYASNTNDTWLTVDELRELLPDA
ncbi:MAG TPA: UDP-N-acetylglucosamine 4,6-dehydratase (inverting) [Candidatus Limnocylindrales bacterium]|jgi:UDP-N-acetylglucosamine 4,6-dehydratase|nr:UDP-N-acetylglucosamine 4,6-dehydratase (inverting) [Candidatus Limnocylindrales bacterium]